MALKGSSDGIARGQCLLCSRTITLWQVVFCCLYLLRINELRTQVPTRQRCTVATGACETGVTDTGRFCPLQPKKKLPVLPAVVGLRLLLIPLLLLCNIPQRSYLPVLFHQDAWFILFMVVLSLSNGYFVSLSMCLAPK